MHQDRTVENGKSGWGERERRLTFDYFCGEIGDPEFKELETTLLESREARSKFRQHARVDTALREVSEGIDDEADIVPLKFSLQGAAVRGGLGGGGWLQVAAMVTMAAVILFLVAERNRDGVVQEAEREADSPRLVQGSDFQEGAMAMLTHAVGVEWEGDLAYAEGASLRPDILKISKGLLQIEFFSGATVVVEGPAQFELIDPMYARCPLGRVRANVPHFAKGFTIDSAEVRVIDYGTEFGFCAEPDGTKEVHVFDGEVSVQGGAAGEEERALLGGAAVRLAGDKMDFIQVQQEAFADFEQIASLASAAEAQQRQQWMRYAEELKANGDVLLFYSFDNQVAWSRQLNNDKKMVADPLAGAIVGCRWAEGRWRGKAGLEFKRQGDRVRISVPGEHDELTLMAWVRIDGFDRELNSLMLSDGWSPGSIHWQFSRAGELILGVKGASNTSGHYQTEPALGQQHLGTWVHLAVSYGGEGGKVIQYVNGRPIWEGAVVHHHTITAPRGELGNWSPATWPPKDKIDIRNLNGRMDEFLMFSAALDPPAVRGIYEKGRPR